jgi:hypothetical protein
MKSRTLLAAAALAAGFAVLHHPAGAATIATENGIAVKPSDVATPSRGMSMDQVMAKFGAPVSKDGPVGRPPITRWEYPGFVVYFEHEHVIHTVVANS